ncbi:uncharacterized protein LOC132708112 [Cylas formicarius]|uniref:uncharacterized protein LOC132708112 n=1 Tax=Cylas formicarius TaxID=197179 RepID=UPI0029586599|nr:uncharacterized protein LOC132708112 [Cylas formicarius]
MMQHLTQPVTTDRSRREHYQGQHEDIKIMQGNVDRGSNAVDMLYKMAEEHGADIVLVAEPNRKKLKGRKWIHDQNMDAAIYVPGVQIKILQHGAGTLHNLREDMKKQKKEMVIGGDFNAKSFLWSPKPEDRRGELLSEWLAEENLIVHNRGSVPTFIRGSSESYIDITFSTQKIARQVINWKVLEEENLSLHQHILYTITGSNWTELQKPNTAQRWVINKERLTDLSLEVGRQLRNNHNNLRSAEHFTATNACDKTFVRKRSSARRPVYWWTAEVTEARKKCIEKKPGQDKKYRPICLINVAGKLLEHLLVKRLKEEIERTGGLADEQHGFREKRSTISALRRIREKIDEVKQTPWGRRKLCALVTVDVENAFNTAPWCGILEELRNRNIAPYLYNIIASYFEDRRNRSNPMECVLQRCIPNSCSKWYYPCRIC